MATGVALSQLRARRVGDSVEVWSRLERRETAAYVGTVRAALVDSTGKVRSTLNAPIAVYFVMAPRYALSVARLAPGPYWVRRSEEHTSELQSQSNLVCRLLLEKKKKTSLYTQSRASDAHIRVH